MKVELIFLGIMVGIDDYVTNICRQNLSNGFFIKASLVKGHGRLRDPPSRSSAWREGFNTPHDYNVNILANILQHIFAYIDGMMFCIVIGYGGILRWF